MSEGNGNGAKIQIATLIGLITVVGLGLAMYNDSVNSKVAMEHRAGEMEAHIRALKVTVERLEKNSTKPEDRVEFFQEYAVLNYRVKQLEKVPHADPR